MSGADHFYVATWREVQVAGILDLEPRYEPQYTIVSGPYRTAMDAWDSAELDDYAWNEAVVLGFRGCECLTIYFEQMDDTPYEDDDFRPDIALEALYEKVSG